MEVSGVGFSLRRKVLKAQLCELRKPWLRWVMFLEFEIGYEERERGRLKHWLISPHCHVGAG
jgi:hypothetical protein